MPRPTWKSPLIEDEKEARRLDSANHANLSHDRVTLQPSSSEQSYAKRGSGALEPSVRKVGANGTAISGSDNIILSPVNDPVSKSRASSSQGLEQRTEMRNSSARDSQPKNIVRKLTSKNTDLSGSCLPECSNDQFGLDVTVLSSSCASQTSTNPYRPKELFSEEFKAPTHSPGDAASTHIITEILDSEGNDYDQLEGTDEDMDDSFEYIPESKKKSMSLEELENYHRVEGFGMMLSTFGFEGSRPSASKSTQSNNEQNSFASERVWKKDGLMKRCRIEMIEPVKPAVAAIQRIPKLKKAVNQANELLTQNSVNSSPPNSFTNPASSPAKKKCRTSSEGSTCEGNRKTEDSAKQAHFPVPAPLLPSQNCVQTLQTPSEITQKGIKLSAQTRSQGTPGKESTPAPATARKRASKKPNAGVDSKDKTPKVYKGRAKPKVKAKPVLHEPIINSPETLNRQIEQQELIFGNSSQLAQERCEDMTDATPGARRRPAQERKDMDERGEDTEDIAIQTLEAMSKPSAPIHSAPLVLSEGNRVVGHKPLADELVNRQKRQSLLGKAMSRAAIHGFVYAESTRNLWAAAQRAENDNIGAWEVGGTSTSHSDFVRQPDNVFGNECEERMTDAPVIEECAKTAPVRSKMQDGLWLSTQRVLQDEEAKIQEVATKEEHSHACNGDGTSNDPSVGLSLPLCVRESDPNSEQLRSANLSQESFQAVSGPLETVAVEGDWQTEVSPASETSPSSHPQLPHSAQVKHTDQTKIRNHKLEGGRGEQAPNVSLELSGQTDNLRSPSVDIITPKRVRKAAVVSELVDISADEDPSLGTLRSTVFQGTAEQPLEIVSDAEISQPVSHAQPVSESPVKYLDLDYDDFDRLEEEWARQTDLDLDFDLEAMDRDIETRPLPVGLPKLTGPFGVGSGVENESADTFRGYDKTTTSELENSPNVHYFLPRAPTNSQRVLSLQSQEAFEMLADRSTLQKITFKSDNKPHACRTFNQKDICSALNEPKAPKLAVSLLESTVSNRCANQVDNVDPLSSTGGNARMECTTHPSSMGKGQAAARIEPSSSSLPAPSQIIELVKKVAVDSDDPTDCARADFGVRNGQNPVDANALRGELVKAQTEFSRTGLEAELCALEMEGQGKQPRQGGNAKGTRKAKRVEKSIVQGPFDGDGFVYIGDLSKPNAQSRTKTDGRSVVMNDDSAARVLAQNLGGRSGEKSCAGNGKSLSLDPVGVPPSIPRLSASGVSQLQAELFPRITAHIQRSTTPIGSDRTANEGKNTLRALSWHEKIMLFQPIVYEELAEWLAEEGICTTFVRPARKGLLKKIEMAKRKKERLEKRPAKVRGGSRKGTGKTEGSNRSVDTNSSRAVCTAHAEFESNAGVGIDLNLNLPNNCKLREDGTVEISVGVKPWMVQKWCDAMGVCGIWREHRR